MIQRTCDDRYRSLEQTVAARDGTIEQLRMLAQNRHISAEVRVQVNHQLARLVAVRK